MSFKLPLPKAVIVLLAIFTTLFCLLFTSVGHQLILFAANYSVTGLDVSLKKGRLLAGEQIDLSWSTDDLDFHIKDLRVKLSWFDCATICLNVSGHSLSFSSSMADPKATNTVHKETAKNNDFFPLSLAVKINQFNQINVQTPSFSTELVGLVAQLKLDKRHIDIAQIKAQKISLELPMTESESQQPLTQLAPLQGFAIEQSFTAQLQQLKVSELLLTQVDNTKAFSHITAAASFNNQQLRWKNVRADHSIYTVRTEGKLGVADTDNPVLDGYVTLSDPANLYMARLNGSLQQLNLSLDSNGSHPASIRGHINMAQANWPFELDATAQNWPITYNLRGKEYRAEVQRSKARITGTADKYAINLQSKIAQAELAETSLNISATGGLSSLNISNAELAIGKAKTHVQGDVSWQNEFKLTLLGQIQHLPLFFIDDTAYVSGNFDMQADNQHGELRFSIADLQLQGELQKQRLAVQANAELNAQLYGQVDRLNIAYGGSSIELQGSLTEQLALTGRFKFAHVADTLLPLNLEGAGEISLSGEHDRPKVAIQAELPSIKSSDFRAENTAMMAKVDFANNWLADISFHAESFQSHNTNLQHLYVEIVGDLADHAINVSNQGTLATSLRAQGSYKNKQWHGTFAHGDVKYQGLAASLDPNHSIFISANKAINIPKLCGNINAAPWCISTELDSRSGTLQARLEEFDLEALSFATQPNWQLSGKSLTELQLAWEEKQLKQLVVNLEGKSIGIRGEQITLPIDSFSLAVKGSEQYAEGSWQLDSSLLGLVDGSIEAAIKDNTISSPKAQIRLHGLALQPIGKIIMEQSGQAMSLDGMLTSDLQLQGDLNKPSITGKLAISEFAARYADLPTEVVNSNIDLTFFGHSGEVRGRLNSKVGGYVSIGGELDWQNDLGAQLNVTGNDLPLSPQHGVEMTLSPDIQLAYDKQHLAISGRVDVPQGRIKIESIPQQVVSLSEDQIILDEVKPTQTSLPLSYSLDLDIAVQDNFRVYAFGLDSYVTGQIALDKSPDTPLLASGEFSLREGVYKALGQDLVIQQGQIGFNGPIAKPYLNIKAIRNPEVTANDVVAGIELTGSVGNPRLNVFSQPAMDQAHALSYLLNGEPLDSSENNNNAILSQLLLAQSINFSENFISKAGSKLGLKDVSVSAKGSGDDTQVELSGYLTPSVQVSYRVGVFDALNEIAVRYRVFSKLYIEATSGLYDSIDLLYQFDWDD